MSKDRASIPLDEVLAAPARESRPGVLGARRTLLIRIAVAASVFACSLVYYGLLLFPGLGGELNAGDSAKFQILGHTPILVHGPGYPLVLMLGAGLRALALPLEPWWALTFALSAVPAALANALAFLIAERLTRSAWFGLAAALLLGSAGLMAIQATEAEVYALALAFILSTVLLLILFEETRDPRYFLAACAVYAVSFGNHLLMIMLVPVFAVIALRHREILVRPKYALLVIGFILLGMSQYLYLAYVSYSPATAYSEYMPLPPAPKELIAYILGLYFSDLYGSGAATTNTLEALFATLKSAHSWVSLPIIAAGIVLFAAGWRRRDATWRGLAVIYGATLAFVPFVLWYGAYDIQAFHLPVLGPLLVATVAALGWWIGTRPVLTGTVAVLLIALGVVRAGQTASYLGMRAPIYTGIKPAMEEIVAQSPVANPLVTMTYGMRMATLYHELLGEMPEPATYRVSWRAVSEIQDRDTVGGIVVPTDGYQFVHWIEHYRPDLTCHTEELELSEGARWPAYAFSCD